MKYMGALLAFLAGCSQASSMTFATDTGTSGTILYTVSAPFNLSGASPVGQQGQLYTAVPQVGEDPFRLTFAFQSKEIDVSLPLMWLAINEDVQITSEVTYTEPGITCTSWKGYLTITGAAPHYNIAINASCNTVGGLSIHGSWSEYH